MRARARVGIAHADQARAAVVGDDAVNIITGHAKQFRAGLERGEIERIERGHVIGIADRQRLAGFGQEHRGGVAEIGILALCLDERAEGLGGAVAVEQAVGARVIVISEARAHRAGAIGIPVHDGVARRLHLHAVAVGDIEIAHFGPEACGIAVDRGLQREADVRAAIARDPQDVIGPLRGDILAEHVDFLAIGADADRAAQIPAVPFDRGGGTDRGDEPVIIDPGPAVEIIGAGVDHHRVARAVEPDDGEALLALDRHSQRDARAIGRQSGRLQKGERGKGFGGERRGGGRSGVGNRRCPLRMDDASGYRARERQRVPVTV
ncbi:hypothetical protein D9M73_132930 [compost metagenome]